MHSVHVYHNIIDADSTSTYGQDTEMYGTYDSHIRYADDAYEEPPGIPNYPGSPPRSPRLSTPYPESPPALEPGCNDDSVDIEDDDEAPSAQLLGKCAAMTEAVQAFEAVAKATKLCPSARTIAAETIVINAMQEFKESGGKLTGQMHGMSDFVHGVAGSDHTMKTQYVFMMQPSPKTVTVTIPSTSNQANMTLWDSGAGSHVFGGTKHAVSGTFKPMRKGEVTVIVGGGTRFDVHGTATMQFTLHNGAV